MERFARILEAKKKNIGKRLISDGVSLDDLSDGDFVFVEKPNNVVELVYRSGRDLYYITLNRK